MNSNQMLEKNADQQNFLLNQFRIVYVFIDIVIQKTSLE